MCAAAQNAADESQTIYTTKAKLTLKFRRGRRFWVGPIATHSVFAFLNIIVSHISSSSHVLTVALQKNIKSNLRRKCHGSFRNIGPLGGLHVVRTSPTTHSALVVIPLATWDINLLYRTYIDWMYNLQPYFGYDWWKLTTSGISSPQVPSHEQGHQNCKQPTYGSESIFAHKLIWP